MTALQALIHPVVVVLPFVVVAVLWRRQRPGLRERGAALLATIAAWAGVLCLNEAAARVGWWRFVGDDLLGQSLAIGLAWAVLWGAVPVLASGVPMLRWLALLAAVDLATMPLLPVVDLGADWLVGEFIGLGLVAAPAATLGRWTAERQHLPRRAALQVGVATVLWVGVVPVVAMHLTGLEPADGWARWVGLQVMVVGAVLALAAVHEFVVVGQGTPWPWDPPRRVVTTGPYRYVRNPMQVGGVLVLLGEALVLGTWFPAGVALVGVAFAATAAAVHEDAAIAARHPVAWPAHRDRVRPWLPHWRPVDTGRTGTLFVDLDCGTCAAIGGWLDDHATSTLVVRGANDRDDAPVRAAHEEAGVRDDGVAAVARALEHVDLGLALCGWLLRLPGVRTAARVIADAVGFGPHPVTPSADGASTSARARGRLVR